MPERAARQPRESGLIGRATARPGLLYRLFRLAFGLLGRLLFRIEVQGIENLPRDAAGAPAGGWICCGLPHRTWSEPFVLMLSLPARPRLFMLGEGPTIFGSAWRAFLIRRVGGAVPVWRGSGAAGFEAIGRAVSQVIAVGGVFAVFPEVGRAARPPELRRVSPGFARLAQRSGARVVPVVFGGTHDLYLRRRITVRILPPLDPPPATAGRADIEAYVGELLDSLAAPLAEAHAAAESGAPRRRRWRWLQAGFPRSE